MEGRLVNDLASLSAYPAGADTLKTKVGLVNDRLHDANRETKAINQRSKTLEMSVDELFDENNLLRVELAAVRDELGATLRAKADTETNLQAVKGLLNAERETVRVLRSDIGELSQTNNGYQRDNSAFHEENVDVRVRVVELTEQNTELAAAAKMAERERTSFEQQLQTATAQYKDLATKLRFATEEYGLKTSPVRVAAGDGRVDLMSNYLRRVAEDHPQAQSAAPISAPAGTGKAAASGARRYLDARGTENTFRANKGNEASYVVPSQNVGWSPTVLRCELPLVAAVFDEEGWQH